MLCDKCKKNQANTHLKTMVNGKVDDMWLCQDCAAELDYPNIFSNLTTDFSSFLGNFLGDGLPARTSASRCKECGASFADIARSGKVGCAHCYQTFYDELLPSIQKMHGNIEHTGKIAETASPQMKIANKIETAKKELSKAIAEQDFETAAKLRDKIKEMEAGESNEQ